LVDELGSELPVRFSLPWWRRLRGEASRFTVHALLPEGYPISVHKHYRQFTIWNFIHMATSSAVGVLSTQSLLYGLGLSSGSLPLSAALNWVIKDGLGQLGGVAIVAYLGARFDVHAKRYRFLGAVLLKASCLLELMVPLVPRHFIPLAAFANILKNVAWMATSATRAQIHRHLALKDNMGDLSGKTAAQNTLASLVGTAMGILCASSFSGIIPTEPLAIVIKYMFYFIPFSIISLLASYRSCQYAVSPRLTVARLEMLFAQLLPELFGTSTKPRKEILSQLHRYVLDPDTLCHRERFLGGNPSKIIGALGQIPLRVEPPLATPLEDESRSFWIKLEPSAVSIWFRNDASDAETLRGMFTVLLLRYYLGKQIAVDIARVEQIVEEVDGKVRITIINRGWDLNEMHLGRRRPILILRQ
jgi:hypothetical protein